MPSIVQVQIHSSQFPDRIREDLQTSLRERSIQHKFHYDSVKQANRWLRVHRKYSAWNIDSECAALHEEAFEAAADLCAGNASIHVISLGCGSGEKDFRLLKRLRQRGCSVRYFPCDVSLSLVLLSYRKASEILTPDACRPFVFDLNGVGGFRDVFGSDWRSDAKRLVCFMGMLPNFEPDRALTLVSDGLRENDLLLMSANLAPGSDYSTGMEHVLPQYDNSATREWLMTFLADLGLDGSYGELSVLIEDCSTAAGLKRITVDYHITKTHRLEIDEERFNLSEGDVIRLFFSYRYTVDRVCKLLRRYGITVIGHWVTSSEEESVFLCTRKVGG